MASQGGKTAVCDLEEGVCVIGKYKPVEGQGTAHERLARAAGIDPENAVGGSIKGDGSVELRCV
jgi:hypothetical protein